MKIIYIIAQTKYLESILSRSSSSSSSSDTVYKMDKENMIVNTNEQIRGDRMPQQQQQQHLGVKVMGNDHPLVKREIFAVSLRKERKRALLADKRTKLARSILKM